MLMAGKVEGSVQTQLCTNSNGKERISRGGSIQFDFHGHLLVRRIARHLLFIVAISSVNHRLTVPRAFCADQCLCDSGVNQHFTYCVSSLMAKHLVASGIAHGVGVAGDHNMIFDLRLAPA